LAAKKILKKEAIRFGWRTMKRNLGFFVGLIILAALIGALPEVGRWLTKETAPLLDLFWTMTGFLLENLLGIGLIRIFLKAVDGEPLHSRDLFSGPPIFVRFLIGNLCYGLLVVAGLILLVIPGIIWALKYQFVPILIVDRGLPIREAFKKSGEITSGAKWPLAFFFLLTTAINILGLLVAVIGLITTLPTTMLAWTLVYRKLSFQTEKESSAIKPVEAQAAPSPPGKARKAWLAVLLSLLLPGLGQVYNGEARRGLGFFIFFLSALLALSLILAWMPVSPLNYLGLILFFLLAYLVSPLEAWRAARRKSLDFNPKSYNRCLVYVGLYIGGSILFWLFQQGFLYLLVEPFRIPSSTMYPAVMAGDLIVGKNISYDLKVPFTNRSLVRQKNPQRFDIILFAYPLDRNKVFIKRIIGLPGEVLQIINKRIYINYQPLQDRYGYYVDPNLVSPASSPRDNYGPVQIPLNHYFVLGDYRDNSYDSRFWGSIDRSDIKSRALMIYWSSDPQAHRIRWERIGCVIR
jgi:signal peptidase I